LTIHVSFSWNSKLSLIFFYSFFSFSNRTPISIFILLISKPSQSHQFEFLICCRCDAASAGCLVGRSSAFPFCSSSPPLLRDTDSGMAEFKESEAPKSDISVVEASKSIKSEMERKRKEKRKKKLLKEAEKANRRGVCYLSRIPPKMDPLKLRQILSAYGEIQRIYLAPEDPTAQMRRKRSGGFRGQEFSEGWVEFADKCIAKKVANMLNGEQIACKNAIREQKLRMELSAANKERDFYLTKVDQSRALREIEERMKKKRKVQNGLDSESAEEQQKPKVIRSFPQKRPLAEQAGKSKSKLSNDVFAEVFRTGNDED
ncbi:Pre-rRNA-processing protein ESF2, partial [Bienertia sinuspersici]